MCRTVAAPVRSVKPVDEPYPMEKERMDVSVLKVIPPEVSLPEPVLFNTAGTSFAGLSPTALLVPAGERSNGMMSAGASPMLEMKQRAKGRRCLVFM